MQGQAPEGVAGHERVALNGLYEVPHDSADRERYDKVVDFRTRLEQLAVKLGCDRRDVLLLKEPWLAWRTWTCTLLWNHPHLAGDVTTFLSEFKRESEDISKRARELQEELSERDDQLARWGIFRDSASREAVAGWGEQAESSNAAIVKELSRLRDYIRGLRLLWLVLVSLGAFILAPIAVEAVSGKELPVWGQVTVAAALWAAERWLENRVYLLPQIRRRAGAALDNVMIVSEAVMAINIWFHLFSNAPNLKGLTDVSDQAPIEVRLGDGQWVVARQGSTEALSAHATQKEAALLGRAWARQEEVEFILKGRDGRIRERYSYGPDLRRSKG